MIKKSKRKVISIITATSIIAATFSTGAKILKDGYICSIYDVERDDMIDDFDINQLTDFYNEDSLFSYTKYPSFSRAIVEEMSASSYDDMVPQGITIMNNYILISSYDYSKKNNSTIDVYKKDGIKINSCELDIKSHVGSIAFDRNNNLVWIPSNDGKINAYLADDFLTKSSVEASYSNFDIGDGLLNYQNPLKNSIAYLTIKDNYLFVGSFSLVSHGLVKVYSIENENNFIKLKYNKSFNVPTRVQGIEFYKYDGKDYVIFSRSFGKRNSSLLQIFPYEEENVNYHDGSVNSVFYEAPSMMEQITIDDTNLYVLFESGAKAYEACQNKINDICVLEADKLVSEYIKKY